MKAFNGAETFVQAAQLCSINNMLLAVVRRCILCIFPIHLNKIYCLSVLNFSSFGQKFLHCVHFKHVAISAKVESKKVQCQCRYEADLLHISSL